MTYYKWMYEQRESVRRVPGFVFMELDEALKFCDEFEGWCVGEGDKNLYFFEGVEPTRVKQSLTSHFGYRTPPHPVRGLTRAEAIETINYFNTKDDDYFSTKRGYAEIPKMLDAGRVLGCLRGPGTAPGVSGVEALYLKPVTMYKMDTPVSIARSVD